MSSDSSNSTPPGGADELIDLLAQEGTLVSEGAFTISGEVAREKLARFQLAEPRSYVLELVQAAVLTGASRIKFEIGRRALTLRFNGHPFTRDDLDFLYGSILASGSSRRFRALQKLALGLNAAQALNPQHLRVTSGVGENGVRWDQPRDESAGWRTISPAPGVTTVHVKYYSLTDFGSDDPTPRSEALSEILFLRDAARFCPIPITVDGDEITQRIDDGPDRVSLSFEGPSLHGTAVINTASDAVDEDDVVYLMSNGVILAERAVDVAGGRLIATVDSARLATDISQRGILENDAFHDAMEACLDAGKRAIRKALVAAPPPGDAAVWLAGGIWPNRQLAKRVKYDCLFHDRKRDQERHRASLAWIIDRVVSGDATRVVHCPRKPTQSHPHHLQVSGLTDNDVTILRQLFGARFESGEPGELGEPGEPL